jgi:hypothetical protein
MTFLNLNSIRLSSEWFTTCPVIIYRSPILHYGTSYRYQYACNSTVNIHCILYNHTVQKLYEDMEILPVTGVTSCNTGKRVKIRLIFKRPPRLKEISTIVELPGTALHPL